MFSEKFLAHPWLVIKAVKRGFGGDLYQIAITFFVLGQHEQMIVGIAFGGGAVVVFFADVEFAADDRLHARMLMSSIYEVDRAKNVAVIGHRHGRHAQLLHMLAELFHVTGAVKHGIVGV